MLVSYTGFGQAASATWAGTSNLNASISGSTITATAVTATGATGIASSTNGVTSSNWTTNNNMQSGYYYQYQVTPTTGNTFTFTGISVAHSVAAGTSWGGAVYYSTNGFTSSTQIGNSFAPATSEATFSQNGLSVVVTAGTTLTIRLYAWDAPTTNRVFRAKNMVISGTTCGTLAFGTQPTGETLCAGGTISLTSSAANAVSYQWKKDNVNISGATSATYSKSNATTADSGSYTVVATNACTSVTSSAATVTVNPAPTSVTANASATTVCAGTSVNLTSSATSNSPSGAITVLSENFNGATNTFTATNNTTGGTNNAGAAWTLRPEGYSYSTSTTVTFSSNDNSQFYLTNSDPPGEGATTSTILQSPSFSTVGLSAANLSFYHYYRRYDGNESGKVEVSTNGTSWTTLATYTSNQGASGTFANVNISLASYLNQATVYIRFKYDATFDYYWAIDNVSVTGTGVPAPTYSWTSSPAGFTSNLQNPTVTPTQNTTYTVTVSNSYGCSASASTALVTVNPTSVGGNVAGSTAVCAPTNSGTLTLSGHIGNVIRWESSANNFATAGTTINNTTTTLNYSNLTATTYYRAVVQSGVCATANSAVATVTVNPASVGGSVAGSATVCAPTNSGTLTLSGHVGTVIGWESSTNNFATAGTPISNTTTSLNYSNLSVTTYYRAIVQSASCTVANSAVATITVNPVSVGGTISGATTLCGTTNSGTLTLSGHVGNVIGWQSSTNNFATAGTPISNTTTSLNYNNLSVTTYYRAIVQSGSCASVNSAVATITVNPISVGGTVSGTTTLCGTTNNGTLTLSGNVGNVIGWESSVNNFATAGTPISNTTTSLNYSNLSVTTYYRAIVQSGSCASANSSIATITVNPVSVGGTVSGGMSLCTGSANGSLTLSGHVGAIIGWESSVNNFATAGIPISNTTTSLNYSNLSATTYYRAIVQSGSCASAYSSVATVTVAPVNVAGTLSGDATYCSHTNSGTLNLNGYTGTSFAWEYSLDNFATAGIPIVNNSASLNYSNLNATTYYRVLVGNGVCAGAYCNTIAITVNSNSTWTGAVSSQWHNAANWSCGEVPQSYTDVLIPSTTNQPIIAADAFAKTVTLQSGTLLTLLSGNDFTVTGAITSSGNFTIENNANLIQIDNVANTGTSKVKRNSAALMRQDYTLWSSPVSGQNLLPFSPQTLTNRFYTYNTSTNLYNTIANPNTTEFAAGNGYLIRMPNNHPTTPTVWNGEFNGTLRNGNIDVTLTNVGAGQRFNAVGNPYPSAIDMETFVNDNASNITGTLYFWRKTNNPISPSYCSWTSGGGFVTNNEAQVANPDGAIRTGQGFIVEASAAGTQVVFNNGQRSGDNSNHFFRSANEIERNRIWLNATNTTGAFSQTLVGYITGSTLDNDPGIDGRFINDGEVSFYSLIAEDRFVIQGRPLPFVDTDIVPMGFKATNAGSYSIAIDHVDGLFAQGQDIFVRDNLTGTVHDLNSGAYAFASEAGTFNGRFELLYQNALSTHDPIFDENSVIVYKQSESFVINSGNMNMASVKVYDVLGKLVKEINDINSSEVSFAVNGANQMLVFRIYSDQGEQVVKKVMN